MALVAAVLFAASVGHATTLYVRISGNDGNDGLTPATALHGIRVAARLLSDSGGQIIVGPGTYREGDISPKLSTQKSQRVVPLEFLADSSGTLTGDQAGSVLVDATGGGTGFLIYGESNVRIDGFYIRGASDAGIQVRYNRGAGIASSNVTITNCVVFSSSKRGIDVQDTADAVVFNNLTYFNGSTGITVGGGILGSADAVVAQNTVYGNGVYGIIIGEGNQSPVASPNAFVVSNIIDRNAVTGLKVTPASQSTYSGAFNVSTDPFEPALFMDITDRTADPLFANPAGPDGVLGGAGFADDDFRLLPGSPAINYGPADVTTIGITGGTQEDRSPDLGVVDAGYHYGNAGSSYVVPPIPQTLIFVRTSGSNSNDGRTPLQALRTLSGAAAFARPGVRVVVGPGTYFEGNISPRLPRSDRRDAPLEFVADPAGLLTGDQPGPVLVDAADNDTGFLIYGESHIRIDGFYVGGAADAGIQVRYDVGAGVAPSDVTIANCVVLSNAKHGIDVRDTANAVILNNLTYKNSSTGISVGGDIVGSANAVVAQNTSYGNGDYGILIGAGDQSPVASPNAVVLSNIVANNTLSGIKVTPASRPTYAGAFNVSNEPLEPESTKDVTDLFADPLFVNPPGADGNLGGPGFADDDFHLQPASPAINYGPADVTAVGLTGGTQGDGSPDIGTVDAGYHYGNTASQYLVPSIPQTPLFVRITGSDANDGRTPDQALRNIRQAAALARPGNRVVVGAGTYQEGDINLGSRSGASQPLYRPIEFVGDPDGVLTGDAGPVVVDAGMTFQTGFDILGSSYVSIDGFYVTGGTDSGIQVRARQETSGLHPSDHVTVSNSIVFSNARSGILVRDSSNATLYNNLVYANGTAGIAVGGYGLGSPNARVVSSTIYGNGANGITIGNKVSQDVVGSTGALVVDSLLDQNGGRSISVTPLSLLGYSAAANLDSTVVGSLGFVAPAGPDGVLGGAGFADDDFHLQQVSAGQTTTGIAVDRGVAAAASMGLDQGTTRTDGVADAAIADVGFHYGLGGGVRPRVVDVMPLLAQLVPASATRTLFVRADGNNNLGGLSPATAFASIGAAAQAAVPGDQIVVAPGTYAEGEIHLNNSGTATQPISFVGDTTGKLSGSVPGPVVVDARGQFDSNFVLLKRSFVQIRGFRITGARTAAIEVRACPGVATDCNPSTGSDHVTISDNVIFSGQRGVHISDSTEAMVFNNLIYANGSSGIMIDGSKRAASSAQVINNTVYRSGAYGILLGRGKGAPNTTLVNNIVRGSAFTGLRVYPESTAGLVLSHNANPDGVTGDAPPDPNAVNRDPAFVQPAGADQMLGGSGFADDDFHLDANRSPAIDASALDAIDLGLTSMVARSDGRPDVGRADLGFHYDVPGPLGGAPMPVAKLFVRALAGDDANDGQTPATALRSIAAAAGQAGAGVTVVIGPGVYREGNIVPAGRGTALNPIRFVADTTGLQTGDAPAAVVIDATGFSTGLYLSGQAYVRLEGLAVMGARLAGIAAVSVAGVEITNCRIFSNAGIGLMLVRPRDGNSVFNNLIYANGGDGVRARLTYVRGGNAMVRIVSNTVYANAAGGVRIDGATYRRNKATLLIANNVIQNNAVDLSVRPANANRMELLANAVSQRPVALGGNAAGWVVMPSAFRQAAGADGVLGGAGFADDDFTVDANSALIDAGTGTAASWGLDHGSIRQDGTNDEGTVDLGSHYTR
jgi:parallel beta-helix repeat protein